MPLSIIFDILNIVIIKYLILNIVCVIFKISTRYGGDFTDNKLIGNNIKEQRNQQKYTQRQLASIIGKTESTIRKYENGSIQVPNDVLQKIAIALNTTLSQLIGLDNVENEKPLIELNWLEVERLLQKTSIQLEKIADDSKIKVSISNEYSSIFPKSFLIRLMLKKKEALNETMEAALSKLLIDDLELLMMLWSPEEISKMSLLPDELLTKK